MQVHESGGCDSAALLQMIFTRFLKEGVFVVRHFVEWYWQIRHTVGGDCCCQVQN